MIEKIMKFIAVPSALLLILAAACSAATWYVRPAGPTYGHNNGTSYNNAWSGFSKINWARIAPGDTLYAAGTFYEKLTVPESGSAGSLITVRGDLANHPGAIDVTTGDAVNISNQSYVALDGLTINRSGTNGITMQGTTYCEVRNCNLYQIGQSGGTLFGIDGRYSQGMYIYNCRLTNERGEFNAGGIVTALGLTGNLAQSTVDRCYIYGIDSDGVTPGNDTVVSRCTIGGLTSLTTHADGIPIEGSRVTVRQNTIYSCTQGIYPNSFDYGPGAASICDDVTISDNLVYQTTLIPHMNAINCDVETGGNASMRRLKIYNNTVVSCDQYGIQIGDRGNGGIRYDGLEIYNNIIVDCGTYTQTGNISVLIDTSTSIPSLKIDYNLVGEYYSPRANYRYQGQDLTPAQMQALGYQLHGINNPPVNSIFASYTYQGSGNNLRLIAGSPAIGAGLNLGSAYAYDITGATRPASGAWDVGCYVNTTSACTFTLTPTSVSYNRNSHSGSFTITASSSTCSWTAVSNFSWINVTSRRSGTGSGRVGYSVSQNNSRVTRTGTITAGGQTFTIRQSGNFSAPAAVSNAPAAPGLLQLHVCPGYPER